MNCSNDALWFVFLRSDDLHCG